MPKNLSFDVNDPDYDDPIVAEVHRIRQEILAEFGNDFQAYSRYLKERERQHPERISKRRPRPIRRAP